MLKFSECSRLIWGQNFDHSITINFPSFKQLLWQKLLTRNKPNYKPTDASKVSYIFQHNTLVSTSHSQNKRGRFNRDPQIGAGLRQAQTCNLRSEFRCSMCPAIHTNSRILLRPSSTCEPSDPPLRIFFENSFFVNYLHLKLSMLYSHKHLIFSFLTNKKEKRCASEKRMMRSLGRDINTNILSPHRSPFHIGIAKSAHDRARTTLAKQIFCIL